MNISRENIDELNAILTVSIVKDDYEATVNDVLKNYRKKANMPGFRPGMVPAGLIKKMYGKAALADEVNKILSKSLTDYIYAEKLNIMGEPLPNEEKQKPIDWDTQTDYDFVFDIGLAPAIEVNLEEMPALPYYTIIADNDLIDKQIGAYTSRFGENKKVDAVGEKDTVRGDFVQLDSEGNELIDGIVAEKVVIAPDLMKDENLKASFVGKQAGDVLVFNPMAAFDNKHEVANLLNIGHEQASNLVDDFRFTIVEVLHFEKAPIDKNLFSKIYGEDSGIETEDDFRAKVKAEIEENFVQSGEYRFVIDSRDALIKTIPFDLPEAFLKRWVKATNKKMTEEQIEAEFDNFLIDLRWQLIKENIEKDNGITVSEDDVKALAKEMAVMQFRQYGINDASEEHLDNYADYMLKNQEERHNLFSRKQTQMISAAIKEKVTLDVKEITLDEFNKMMEK